MDELEELFGQLLGTDPANAEAIRELYDRLFRGLLVKMSGGEPVWWADVDGRTRLVRIHIQVEFDPIRPENASSQLRDQIRQAEMALLGFQQRHLVADPYVATNFGPTTIVTLRAWGVLDREPVE